MRRSLLVLAFLLVVASLCMAQEPGGTPVLEAPEVDLTPKGDVISLKNGNQIIGQVVRSDPEKYDIEVAAGIVLELPRKQVENIVFDDFEPGAVRSGDAGEGAADESSLIPGKKLSRELHDKLNKVISEEPLRFERQDLMAVLKDLGKRLNINIVIDKPVKKLESEKRVWDLSVEPGTKMLAVLEERLPKRFKNLEVVYLGNKVVVTTREAAEKLKAERADSSAEAPKVVAE